MARQTELVRPPPDLLGALAEWERSIQAGTASRTASTPTELLARVDELDMLLGLMERHHALTERQRRDDLSYARERRIERQEAIKGWIRVAAMGLCVVGSLVAAGLALTGQLDPSDLVDVVRRVPG